MDQRMSNDSSEEGSGDIEEFTKTFMQKIDKKKKPRKQSKYGRSANRSDSDEDPSSDEHEGDTEFQPDGERDASENVSDTSSDSESDRPKIPSPEPPISRLSKNPKKKMKLAPTATHTSSNDTSSDSENELIADMDIPCSSVHPNKKMKLAPTVTGTSSNDSQSESEMSENELLADVDSPGTKLREELADVPFEDLTKLKEKIGLKAYSQVMSCSTTQVNKSKNAFKRANKNRPMEKTSKKPVGRYMPVTIVKKKKHRDPRFDDLSGTYDEAIFKKSYSFLDVIQEKEKKKMIDRYKKVEDPEEKKKISTFLSLKKQHEKSEKVKKEKEVRAHDWKKRERDLVKQGKKPFYLKKSDEKKLDLVHKFSELKKSGKVDKYLARKRKKTAAKDRKHLPSKTDVFSQ